LLLRILEDLSATAESPDPWRRTGQCLLGPKSLAFFVLLVDDFKDSLSPLPKTLVSVVGTWQRGLANVGELDFRIKEILWHESVAVEPRRHLPNGLHILLRHRPPQYLAEGALFVQSTPSELRRQTDGFDGILVIQEVLVHDDLRVPERHDLGQGDVIHYAALLGMEANAASDHDAITGVYEVFNDRFPGPEGGRDVFEVAAGGIGPESRQRPAASKVPS
jgi:hypothetical protein